jgi:MoaA/NifB/PqqE/SkfB family radical SAM enzyme
MSSCNSKLPNFEFDRACIHEALKDNRLLSVEIEFSRRCNFKCAYCYIRSEDAYKDEMTRNEIRDVIVQAQELGARKIIVLGGEPMVYPAIFAMLESQTDATSPQRMRGGCLSSMSTLRSR